MDNPAGLKLDDSLLVRTKNPISGEKGHYIVASQSKPGFREKTLNASGFSGVLQIEDPIHYMTSPLKMNYFVYNTSEWVKNQLKKSKNSRDVQHARIFFGSGLHGVEDFFAHSNFIEIAINSLLDNADKNGLPSEYKKIKKYDGTRWVDTLYDKGDNNNITTGTFASGLDTGVSIAYIILSKMPVFFDLVDKGIDMWLDKKLDKVLDIISKKKTVEKRRIEFEKRMKEYSIDYKGYEVLNTIIEGMEKAKFQLPTFETITIPKDLQITIPCTHLRAPHPNGDTVTIPCTHLRAPHPNGDTVTIPCTHLRAPHPNGDTVTIPCLHKTVRHPKGHMKFGVKVPCVHMKTKHPKGHKKKVPCTHKPIPRHPNGDKINKVCTHKPIPRHPNGDKINKVCTHKPIPRHPNGDKIKLSQSPYGHFSKSLLGSKIPVGIKYDSPKNAFKTYREVNETGHKVWAHYVTMKEMFDSLNLPKQAKLWLVTKWDNVTKEYRELIRDHTKMLIVLSLRVLVPGIPIRGIQEKDGYKIKGDYTKVFNLVKKAIETAEVNTYSFSKDSVRKDDPSLPPTHSEISKDHPKTDVKAKSQNYHLHGSIFYDIHYLLAKHAVQHITLEMNKFSERRILINHGMTNKQIQKYSKLNKDVKSLSTQIKEEAKSIRRTFHTDKNYPVFDVVDYYISHPAKTIWWRPILIKYMKNHTKSVIEDINRRNKTRKERNGVRTKINHIQKRVTNSRLIRTKPRIKR